MAEPDHHAVTNPPHEQEEARPHAADHDGPVAWMRQELAQVLFGEDTSGERLKLWLQGLGLPGVGYDEEPYAWLLRTLPPGDDRFEWETALARQAAALLGARPDAEPMGGDPQDLLSNPPPPCAGLSCPDELGEPLWRMYERRVLDPSLRDALVAALATNQIDDRLQAVWHEMAAGGNHAFLPGDEHDGFEGLVLMPDPEEGRGAPAIVDIGLALGEQARLLEENEERRIELRALIDRVIDLYPGHRRRLKRELLLIADRNEWPDWAVQCLPSLFLTETDSSNGSRGQRYYLWRFYLELLEPIRSRLPFEISDDLCRGEIYLVSVSDETESFIRAVFPDLEDNRRRRLQQPLRSATSLEQFLLNQTSTVAAHLEPERPNVSRLLAISRGEVLKRKAPGAAVAERDLSNAHRELAGALP